jgi:hypothetical protein
MAKSTRGRRAPRSSRDPNLRIVTLHMGDGPPRRRADIIWTKSRRLLLRDIANHRDCGGWQLPIGSIIKIRNGED